MRVFGWLRSFLVVLNPATHARNIFASMSFRGRKKPKDPRLLLIALGIYPRKMLVEYRSPKKGDEVKDA